MYIYYERNKRNHLLNMDNVTNVWIRPNSGEGLFVPSICYTTIDNKDGIITVCNDLEECNEVLDTIYKALSDNSKGAIRLQSKDVKIAKIYIKRYIDDARIYTYPINSPEYLIGHVNCVEIGKGEGYSININDYNGNTRLSDIFTDEIMAKKKLDEFKQAIRSGKTKFEFSTEDTW